ncbi:MAG: PqiC family protein [Deltaproteobacteria bacterium]|nr:PqiC family protein [Deltaproteobacteria bacterium]
MTTVKRLEKSCSMWMVLLVLGSALTACAGSGTPSTFYMLRSMENPQESLSETGKDTISLLVGPVTLPAYLDRNQMVTIAGNNEVALDEFNRWAESLRESFYRVLLEDLSFLLKTPKVYRYDQSGENDSDYQVSIDVTRFDCTPEGDAVLTAFWTVRGKDNGTPGITKKSVFRTPVSSPGFPGMVDALNQTLTAFGREIASAIESLER